MKSDLSRHTVLVVSLRFILVASQFHQWIKQAICVEHTFIVIENIHVMTDVPYIDFWFILYWITYSVFDITWWGCCNNPFKYAWTLKWFKFITISVLRYIYQKLELMCSYIDTEWLITKYLLSMLFVIQYETKMMISLSYILLERELCLCFIK